ncbi:hypothetical protein KIN20_015476 [Parelaphostrongylus tenuis]|uniref:Uncharacterized protein n=1 Tax=Parelaphostrongylus tenuis TaxID=148309 RepID=A0AAD5QP18_PARTN|nr:hypothetical protein KIN20_015476 [Parelaphostrongylus tenuis]
MRQTAFRVGAICLTYWNFISAQCFSSASIPLEEEALCIKVLWTNTVHRVK